jgi:hypothetical protein
LGQKLKIPLKNLKPTCEKPFPLSMGGGVFLNFDPNEAKYPLYHPKLDTIKKF